MLTKRSVIGVLPKNKSPDHQFKVYKNKENKKVEKSGGDSLVGSFDKTSLKISSAVALNALNKKLMMTCKATSLKG